jgi:adenylate cyclase
MVILISSVLSLALIYGFMRPLQLASSDQLFRLKTDSTARHAVLVTIDDRSVAELRSQGRVFNWPRQLYARAIDNLKAAGARFIAFDVLFDSPAEGDAELARAIKQANNVILAEAVEGAVCQAGVPSQELHFDSMLQQLPAFRESAVGIGHANQCPDTDGAIRATPLRVKVAGSDVAALPLTAAATFIRRPHEIGNPIQAGKMLFAGREIPVDPEGRMWISYLADSHKVTNPPTFTAISFVDAVSNTFAPELVRSKMVFLGIAATAFADDYWTPVSRTSKMDGVEIHANAFETIMRPERFIVPATRQMTVGLIYLAGVVAVLALTLLPPVPAVVAGVLTALAYLFVAVVVIDPETMGQIQSRLPFRDQEDQVVRGSGLLLDISFPMMNLGLCYLGVLMYRVIVEQAQQRALKGAMSQYLSPDVMEEIARDPSAIKLGGEKREMTVLFSDLRGFTSLSETLEPEQLVQILNTYLTRMSDVVFKHQGTIDKYMGDAIMAFWGAPRPQPDHARRACLVAIEMVRELEQLNAEFAAEGIPKLMMGIGLNTGQMAVGNMGSQRRFDYTIMGDAVNLGSRLEGLNKEYGTSIILSEATLQQAGPDVRARFLDLVAVKGKKEPTAVYELLATDGLATNGALTNGRADFLAAYERGIDLYRTRDYISALTQFETALRLDGDDGPTAVYLERSRDLAANPPAPDWDGVYVMTRK